MRWCRTVFMTPSYEGLKSLPFRTSVPNISSEHLETASLYFLLIIFNFELNFWLQIRISCEKSVSEMGSHQISLKSSCIFVNFVFLRVLIRLISCVGSEHCSEHCLFRTSVPNTVSEPLWRSLWSLYKVFNKLPPKGGRGKPLPTFGELLKTL